MDSHPFKRGGKIYENSNLRLILNDSSSSSGDYTNEIKSIRGIVRCLTGMCVNDSKYAVIPPNHAFGSHGNGSLKIGKNWTIIAHVTVSQIEKGNENQQQQQVHTQTPQSHGQIQESTNAPSTDLSLNMPLNGGNPSGGGSNIADGMYYYLLCVVYLTKTNKQTKKKKLACVVVCGSVCWTCRVLCFVCGIFVFILCILCVLCCCFFFGCVIRRSSRNAG